MATVKCLRVTARCDKCGTSELAFLVNPVTGVEPQALFRSMVRGFAEQHSGHPRVIFAQPATLEMDVPSAALNAQT